MKNDEKKDNRVKRLTKEQLEAIRGGLTTNLPDPTTQPVFYTEPVGVEPTGTRPTG